MPIYDVLTHPGVVNVGTLDWMCNFKANERWAHEMNWNGRDAFNAAESRAWVVEDKTVGETKSANGLTFATIQNAGHFVSTHIYA